jgi:diketogulonate reductase-like aldo/keto reductase
MTLSLETRWKLNNGLKMPILGLGTWALSGSSAIRAVNWALEEGYRLIDTATIYGNEREIGKAIKQSSIKRENIFLTSKVWETDFGFKSTIKAFESSLRKLKTDYLDLYLIHWPRKGRSETWQALVRLYEENRVKSIGVSNYTIEHLEKLLEETSIIPAVNQVEFSPFLYQKDLLEYCKEKNIQLEAYSPLTRAHKLDNHLLKKLSQKYSKTPAQVLLRWIIQHNIIPIPKSSSKNHIKENAKVFNFTIEENDMKKLNDLNQDYRVVDDSVFD